MEVTLRPAPMGCLRLVLGVLTLGLVPLLLRSRERHFIRLMDDAGFETRDGRRVAWAQVTGFHRAQGRLNGNVISDELLIDTPHGQVSLPIWRAEDAPAVWDYARRRLPASASDR